MCHILYTIPGIIIVPIAGQLLVTEPRGVLSASCFVVLIVLKAEKEKETVALRAAEDAQKAQEAIAGSEAKMLDDLKTQNELAELKNKLEQVGAAIRAPFCMYYDERTSDAYILNATCCAGIRLSAS